MNVGFKKTHFLILPEFLKYYPFRKPWVDQLKHVICLVLAEGDTYFEEQKKIN